MTHQESLKLLMGDFHLLTHKETNRLVPHASMYTLMGFGSTFIKT